MKSVVDPAGVRKRPTAQAETRGAALFALAINLRSKGYADASAQVAQWARDAYPTTPVPRELDARHPPVSPAAITMSSLLDSHLRRRTTDTFDEQTLIRDRSKIKNHIRPHLGTMPVTEITEDGLLDFFELLKAKRRTRRKRVHGQLVPVDEPLLGPIPLRAIHGILNQVFTDAVKRQYISKNPLADVGRAQRPKHASITYETYSSQFSDVRAMMDELGVEERFYWYFAFLGLRQSERLGLQREQVYVPAVGEGVEDGGTNLPSVRLTIDRQLKRSSPLAVKMNLKSDAGKRTLHLPNEFGLHVNAAISARERQLGRKMAADDFFFVTDDGVTPIRHQQDTRRWTSLLSRHGIAHMNAHRLRHFAATWLAEEGVHPQAAMVILGHSDALMTIYYTHLGAKQSAAPLLALSAALSERDASMIAGRELIIGREHYEWAAREQMEREGWELLNWSTSADTTVRIILKDGQDRLCELHVDLPNGLDPGDVWGYIENTYGEQF